MSCRFLDSSIELVRRLHLAFGAVCCTTVAVWAGLGCVMVKQELLRRQLLARTITTDEFSVDYTESTVWTFILQALLLIALFCRDFVKRWERNEERPSFYKSNSSIDCNLACIGAVGTMIVSLTYYYGFNSTPIVREQFIMMAIGTLTLVLMELLDNIRAILVPFNRTFSNVAITIGFCVVIGMFVAMIKSYNKCNGVRACFNEAMPGSYLRVALVAIFVLHLLGNYFDLADKEDGPGSDEDCKKD